jgi:hypothetical protein
MLCGAPVGRLAGCEPKVYRQTVGVHNGVNLTRQSASRVPHMLLCIARDIGAVLTHGRKAERDATEKGPLP